jgi:hypothetical protein
MVVLFRMQGLAAVALTAVLLAISSPADNEGRDAEVVPAEGNTAETEAPEAPEARLLWPTLGRPAFVAPGDAFCIYARMPQATQPPVVSLLCQTSPKHRHLLRAGAEAGRALGDGEALRVEVPAYIVPATYDLEIRWGRSCVVGKHCVAVGTPPERIRIVHLSNMNVGDVGAADFDARLIEEVNLVAPTLIGATGDYLDATHADPVRGWLELGDFLARFDAPAVLACGDHDEMALYSRFVAPSPIGVVEVGRCRGIVLLDHTDNPIERDAEQLHWVERVLTEPNDERVTFVVSHAEAPNLLRCWQRQGRLEQMVRGGGLGVWFAGGHRDWDGREYAGLVTAAAPMLFLRTHQSSTAAQDGAEGVSHYRVVDLAGTRAFLPGEARQGRPPASIPVGRLGVKMDAPNDATRTRLAVTATSSLPYRMEGLAARVLLRPEGDGQPWCQGATLERATRIDGVWECRLRFDLPDKGSLRAVVGTGPEPPRADVQVRIGLPSSLQFAARASADGLRFCSASETSALVYVRNRGEGAVEARPLVRLDGDRVAYRLVNEEGPFATAYRLRLQPGEEVVLELDLSAVRVRPGRRELQVYLEGEQAYTPVCHPLDVEVTPAESLARTDRAR